MDKPDTERPDLAGGSTESFVSSLRRVGLAHAMDRGRSVDRVSALTEEAAKGLHVSRVGLWMYEDGGTVLRCVDLFDAAAGTHSRDFEVQRTDCPAHFAALAAEGLLSVPDAPLDPRTRERANDYLTPHGLGAIMGAPVWRGDHLAGVVYCEHAGGPRQWSEAELAFASAVGMVASLHTTTEHQEATETALRERDDIDRRVFESSPVALAQFDLSAVQEGLRTLRETVTDGCERFLDDHPEELLRLAGLLEAQRLNAAAVTLYRAPSEEVLRARLEELVLPGSLPVFKQVVLALATGRRAVSGDSTHRTVDGGEVHVRVLCHLPSRPSESDPLVVSVVDLTEQKTSEELLRGIAQGLGTEMGARYFEAAAKFLGERMGADLAFVGELTRDGSGVRTLAAWRDGSPAPDFEYRLEGSPCQEVVGHWPAVHEDGVCDLFPEDQALIDIGARGYVGAPLFAADGTALGVVVAVFRSPLSDSQRTESILKIFASRASAELERLRADLHRQDLEARLIHAQRLESVGRLAGGVAHDFNNLLAPIMAYAEMALDAVDEGDPLQEDLTEILNAAERATRVTRQLLAFSRRQVLQIEAVDLNATVAGFARMIRTVTREDIHLDTRLTPDLPTFRGDQGQVEQVLLNLVLNAQDAMPTGGRLAVATFSRTITGADHELPAGTYVCLEVADTGTGMDEVTREHIFEPFFTTKSSQDGTGLGLATVYGIVQQHHGGIRVQSEVGEGSTFHICFPASGQVDAATVEGAADPGRRSGSERIMVVEDEAAVRRLVVTVLRRHGYDVVEAATSLEGLEMALDPALELDLLVTDVVMPQMDGVELYQRIHPIRPELPVLYLSGYAHDVIASRGVTDVNLLRKPFTLKDLTERVRDVLDS